MITGREATSGLTRPKPDFAIPTSAQQKRRRKVHRSDLLYSRLCLSLVAKFKTLLCHLKSTFSILPLPNVFLKNTCTSRNRLKALLLIEFRYKLFLPDRSDLREARDVCTDSGSSELLILRNSDSRFAPTTRPFRSLFLRRSMLHRSMTNSREKNMY
jgi:hypothetical protein